MKKTKIKWQDCEDYIDQNNSHIKVVSRSSRITGTCYCFEIHKDSKYILVAYNPIENKEIFIWSFDIKFMAKKVAERIADFVEKAI